MTPTTDPQTYWKKIKVPPTLLEAGWKLIKRDTSAPFALVNEKLDQDTGGFPDPQEAIAAAQALTVELEEAQAIASEGQLSNGERPTVLPLALIDEGWILRYEPGAPGTRGIFAERGELRTAANADVADTVAQAINLEHERQAEIERRELGHAAIAAQSDVDASLEPRGDQADLGDNIAGTSSNGHGQHHNSTPAEILLELTRIRTDGGTQQRALFDQNVVADYLEVMEAGGEFPAVDVFFDGADYWLADGFYRYKARHALGQPAIAAHVRQGTQRDAILFSLGANARHGLPRTPEDKRRAVLVMLRDPEWAAWSDAYIAERVRVSVPLVRRLRHQEAEAAQVGTATDQADQEAPTSTSKRRGRDGRVVDTSKIGKRKSKDPDPQLELAAAPATPPAPSSATSAAASTPEATAATDLEPARPILCEGCNVEIGAHEFRNAAGLCWECAGMDKKRPRSKPALDDDETKATPTIATLGHARNLKLSFYMLASQPGRIYVSVTATGKSKAKGGGWSGDMELEAAELTLPPSVLELVSIALDHAARPLPRKATKKAASPKSSYKITTKKATPPPARKAAVKRSKPNQKNLVPERKKTVASKTTKTARRPAKASATATRRKPTRKSKGKRSR